ncbi:MAG: ABC transporter ATP-binding protein [Corallococcus sp.]|nr:ABC transporter ATP-binding protein [Corallococcus sp.]MCM1359768.1 ABC transporter ATP-binding protein [Corallococcus sp.]MCM1395706.1 ABC transporter ATP-binding protein [Corallococcus sp.]
MIAVRNLIKTYADGENLLYAVNDASFEISNGEFVVILGPSGSGKSTLLNLISGLDRADSGSVIHDGIDITQLGEKSLTKFRKENTAFIFQAYYLLPALTVRQNVQLGASLAGTGTVDGILQSMGLSDKMHKYPHQLSGGEQQRVSIARALSKNPKTLFCDEPTGALDEETGRKVMGYLVDLHREKGFTVVMVTHNANFAGLASTVIKMNSGRVVSIDKNDKPLSVAEIGW